MAVVGFTVGTSVGSFVGLPVGLRVGFLEGFCVGDFEGLTVGLRVGCFVGNAVVVVAMAASSGSTAKVKIEASTPHMAVEIKVTTRNTTYTWRIMDVFVSVCKLVGFLAAAQRHGRILWPQAKEKNSWHL